MAALSEFFPHLHRFTALFFLCLLFEVVHQVRSVTRNIRNYFGQGKFSAATEYLKFIEENIPTISYSNRLGLIDCAVCLSGFIEGETVRKLKCKHTYHKNCLDKWLQRYLNTCPICRTEVLPGEVVADYELRRNLMENEERYEEDRFILSVIYANHSTRSS